MTIEWKARPSRAADNSWYIDSFVNGCEWQAYIKVDFVVDTHNHHDISARDAAELYSTMPNALVADVQVLGVRPYSSTKLYTVEEAKAAIIQNLIEGQLCK